VYSEAAEEVGNWVVCHCGRLLAWNGIGFWPLCKIIHSDEEVTVSLVDSWERACHIVAYHFICGHNIFLMNVNPIPGLGATTCSTNFALLAPSLNIASCLGPVAPLPNHISVSINPQATS
jgi:hypothetical protein